MTLVATSLLVAGCGQGGDWRASDIDAAEAKIRVMVDDRLARFDHVQLTGDASTGQTCGEVSTRIGGPRRFIVYIDGTAGPFIDSTGNQGLHDRFESDWSYDCVNEGYSA